MAGLQPAVTIKDGVTIGQTDIPSDVDIDLSKWPKIFLLPTHLSEIERNEVEEQLETTKASLAHEISEAAIVLTAINSQRRAKFELQTRQVKFKSIESSNSALLGKRRRHETFEDQPRSTNLPVSSGTTSHSEFTATDDQALSSFELSTIEPDYMLVLKLSWLSESISQHKILNVQPYAILEGRILNSVSNEAISSAYPSLSARDATSEESAAVAQSLPSVTAPPGYSTKQSLATLRRTAGSHVSRHLVRETTSEHDETQSKSLPELPQWVKDHNIYACQRRTRESCPNDRFVSLLKKIKLVRTLNMDEIGVRAYSTSIASIKAYPHPLTDPKELLSLPGCEQKIADLFREYQNTGQISEAQAIDNDETLKLVGSFYSIWGVGARTAREFFAKGWRDTDDIVQHGWNDLTRVQQIGLKYAEDFEKKISRSEVEFIASVVTYHAKQIVDEDITCTIVGGYRRGKHESGDVDMIISHPRLEGTRYLIRRLVRDLEKSQWISHTLTLSEANSARDQQTLGLKLDPTKKGGFDTLDKALVVWQDPGRVDKDRRLSETSNAKNSNIHRRVDIIISPWSTLGCAVAGWTSGTTFQRDLRRYAKNVKGWKFDSSGIRDRGTGRWVDLECYTDKNKRAKTPLEAEKRVFAGLGLEYVPPEERCTD